MKLYTDSDASLELLQGKTAAIIGYGNQGRAQALNLRDSGVTVIVGNRDDDYKQAARADGFAPVSILEAATAGDYLFILTTDECQPIIWDEQILPGLNTGDMLVWASGYNIGYQLIRPPETVDVVMVAPRMTGHMVRELYTHGQGAMAQIAVHQDATGAARERMMAVAKGIGCTRGGVFDSTFREEAELDLFAEQVVWAGLVAWFEACFDLGITHGFSPELMVLELYGSGEAAEILSMMAKRGFYQQMAHHSTTSQYGTLSRAQNLLDDSLLAKMKASLIDDIKGGAFVEEWQKEQAAGLPTLEKLKLKAMKGKMSRAEEAVIPLVQKAHSLDQ